MYQLDLNAPLLSTRRRSDAKKSNHHSHSSMRDTSRIRVPFSWERAPGVPKDAAISAFHSHTRPELVPPKPPPGRQCCKMYTPKYNDVYSDDEDGDHAFEDNPSFSESFGVAYRLSDASVHDQYTRVPSFIMNRFLPAADAVAGNSSNPNVPKYSRPCRRLERELSKPPLKHRITIHTANPKNEYHRSQSPPPPPPTPPTDVPWSLKHTVCGYKSPVRSQTPRANVGGLTVRTNSIKTGGLRMPFLDTSRLRLRGRRSDMEKQEFKAAAEARVESGRSLDRRGVARVFSEKKRLPSWSLPHMRSPSEPWLSHALNSYNT